MRVLRRRRARRADGPRLVGAPAVYAVCSQPPRGSSALSLPCYQTLQHRILSHISAAVPPADCCTSAARCGAAGSPDPLCLSFLPASNPIGPLSPSSYLVPSSRRCILHVLPPVLFRSSLALPPGPANVIVTADYSVWLAGLQAGAVNMLCAPTGCFTAAANRLLHCCASTVADRM